MLRSFEAAAAHFARLLPALRGDAKRPVLVCVGGPTAVGKSTLARMFRDAAGRVRARVLEGDRFLIPQDRRAEGARFPEGVYEVDRLLQAVAALREGREFRAPFYERDGRATGRFSVAGSGPVPPEVAELCRGLRASPSGRLEVDPETGDVLEAIRPGAGEVWIFDSELALFYPELKARYDASYGIRAPRAVRRRNFLNAVRRGERYPLLTEAEAEAKIEGFFDTDDALIEPTVDGADYLVAIEK